MNGAPDDDGRPRLDLLAGSGPLRALELGIGIIAGTILFAMMTLTFVDVLGRYVFNAPVPGGFQAMTGFLALVMFVGVALICLREEQLTVGILETERSALGKARGLFIALLSALLLAGFAWRVWVQAGETLDGNEVLENLDIKLGYVLYLAAGCAIAGAIFAAGHVVRRIVALVR